VTEPRSTSEYQTDPAAPVRAAACLLAVALVGQAIFLGSGQFSPAALALVGVSILLIAAAVLVRQPSAALTRIASRSLGPLIALGLIGGLVRLPGLDVLAARGAAAPPEVIRFLALAFAAAVLLGVLLLAESRALLSAAFPLLVTLHLLMAVAYVRDYEPGIDVLQIQQVACDALVHGRNPYAITFEDRYGPDSPFAYDRRLVVDGQVQCGYFYPPPSLLLDVPAYLAGDLRYAHVVATALTAVLIGYAPPRSAGRLARAWSFRAAALLLFTPLLFYQLQMAWIEPFLLLFLCAAVFFAMRGWTIATAAAVGLLLATKQYTPFVAPAALLLVPRPWTGRNVIRFAGVVAVAGAIVTLPFVLWSPRAFFHSLTALYVGIMRADSISFLPPIARAYGLRASFAYPLLASLPAIALVLWRAPRTPAGFAIGSALILTCVFAFHGQAFGNYYLLVVGALCAGVAALAARLQSPG
jgi:hypothetical protein